MTTSSQPPAHAFVFGRRDDGSIDVHVIGNLLMYNREQLKRMVVDSIIEGGRVFTFDFTQCPYIDASGQGVLVSVSKKIKDIGGTMTVVGLNDDLTTLFELTKLDTLFDIKKAPAVADA